MSKYRLSFKTQADLLKYIEEQDIQFIDCTFTDLSGRLHHVARHKSAFSGEMIEKGVAIDSSSFAGWRFDDISDLLLVPDLARVSYDPFSAQKTIKVFCDVYEPVSGRPYLLDPRAVAKKAFACMTQSEMGNAAYFGPEIEFFVFDDVRIVNDAGQAGCHLDSEESPRNAGREYRTGNMGHRPAAGGGYMQESPVDSLSDIRAEMLSVVESMGVSAEEHSHRSAPGQCAHALRFANLLESADSVQLYKYAVRNVAHSYGKSATFMPCPVSGEAGSLMRLHQSLWKDGKPLFFGEEFAELSGTALYYIGGILKHARALNAFTNPTTNSYKRFNKTPVLLGYSKHNPLTACRVPYARNPAEKRIETCFPDPSANPYLAFAALLMAGLAGIENKIDPGHALDHSAQNMPGGDMGQAPAVCTSLRQALQALEEDYSFLLKRDVFSRELIEAYITLKRKEVERCETTTHPVEVDLYYSE